MIIVIADLKIKGVDRVLVDTLYVYSIRFNYHSETLKLKPSSNSLTKFNSQDVNMRIELKTVTLLLQ